MNRWKRSKGKRKIIKSRFKSSNDKKYQPSHELEDIAQQTYTIYSRNLK
jgi:hypothetical protein